LPEAKGKLIVNPGVAARPVRLLAIKKNEVATPGQANQGIGADHIVGRGRPDLAKPKTRSAGPRGSGQSFAPNHPQMRINPV